MRVLARLICQHARLVLLGCAVVTAASALLVTRLRLDTDIIELLPEQSATAAAFGRFARAFGREQSLIVLARADDPARLRRFADAYAAALGRSPLCRGVRHRVSAAALELMSRHLAVLLDEGDYEELRARTTPAALAERAHRLRALGQGPAGRLALERLARDPLELLPLLGRRLAAGRSADPASGYFASADGRALLLFVTPARPPADLEYDAQLEAEVRRLAAAMPDGAAVRIEVTGAPAYHLAYARLLRGDLTRSTVFALVGVLVLFALCYRAARILPLLALTLGAGILWTLATAALLFHRIGALSLAFAAILLGIGIDVPIQLYNRLRDEVGREPRDAVRATLEDLLGPAVLATLGPAAVFAACALSQFPALRELGGLAAVGLLCNLVVSVALLPALLVTLPKGAWTGPARPRPRPRLLAALATFLTTHPRAVVLGGALLVLAAAPFAARLRLQPHVLEARPTALAPARAERAIDEAFAGSGAPGGRLVALAEAGALEPVLEANDAWAQAAALLRRTAAIAGYDSLATLVPSQRTQAERLALLRALDPPRIARDLAAALESVGLTSDPFAHGLAPLVQPTTITVDEIRQSELAFVLLGHLREHAGRFTAATYVYPRPDEQGPAAALLATATHGVRAAAPAAAVTATGGALLDEALRGGLLADLFVVTGASLVAVLVLLVAYYRRPRPAAVVLLSLGLAWVVFAALMHVGGVPLNLFDLLVVPFVLGYGIDDLVFLVHRGRHAAGDERPAAAAVVSIGRAITLTSLTTAVGFGGLLLARLEGLRHLGAAGVLAVLCCLGAALGVAPALCALLLRRER